MISVGIFAYDSDDIAFAGYSTDVSQGYRLGIQLLAVIIVAAWCLLNGIAIFGVMSFFKVLRVDLETEKKGLDEEDHGGSAYSMEMAYQSEGSAPPPAASMDKEVQMTNTE